jgi:hypothetical protein
VAKRKLPEDIELRHDGKRWHLSFGNYRAHFAVCACDLPVCTCKRQRARWDRGHNHEHTHCHAGHAEHVAILFRKIVRGVKH